MAAVAYLKKPQISTSIPLYFVVIITSRNRFFYLGSNNTKIAIFPFYPALFVEQGKLGSFSLKVQRAIKIILILFMTLKIQNYTIFLLENNLNVGIRYTSLFLVPIAALHLLFGICNIYTIGISRFNKIYYFIKPEATQYNKIISVVPPVSIMLEDLLEEFMDLVGDWLPIQIAFATILLVLLWGLRAGCIRNNIKGNENDWVLLTIVIIALIIFAPWGLLFIKACLFNKRFRNVVYDNWFWQTIYAWFIFIVLTSKPGPKGLVPRHLTLRQWIVVWTTIILLAFILPWLGIYLRDYFSWQTRIRFGKKK